MTTFIFCAVCLLVAIASGFATAMFMTSTEKEKPTRIQPLNYKWVLWNEEKLGCSKDGAEAFLLKRLQPKTEYRIEASLSLRGDNRNLALVGDKQELLDYINHVTYGFTNIKIFVRSDQIDEFEFKTANELKDL